MTRTVTIEIDPVSGQVAVADGVLFLGDTAPIKFTGYTPSEGEYVHLQIRARDGKTILADNSIDEYKLDLSQNMLRRAFQGELCDHTFPCYVSTYRNDATTGEAIQIIAARGVVSVAWAPSDFDVDNTLEVFKGEKGDKGATSIPVEAFCYTINLASEKGYADEGQTWYDDINTKKYYIYINKTGTTIRPPNEEYWKEITRAEICDGCYGWDADTYYEGLDGNRVCIVIYDAHNTKSMYLALKASKNIPVTNKEYWQKITFPELLNLFYERRATTWNELNLEISRASAAEGKILKTCKDKLQDCHNLRDDIEAEAATREEEDLENSERIDDSDFYKHKAMKGAQNPHATTLLQLGAYSKAAIDKLIYALGQVQSVDDQKPDSTGNVTLKAKDTLDFALLNGLWALPAYTEWNEGTANLSCYIPPINSPSIGIESTQGSPQIVISENAFTYDLFVFALANQNIGSTLTPDGSRVLTRLMADAKGFATKQDLYYLQSKGIYYSNYYLDMCIDEQARATQEEGKKANCADVYTKEELDDQIDSKQIVKTVNNKSPDENGNIELTCADVNALPVNRAQFLLDSYKEAYYTPPISTMLITVGNNDGHGLNIQPGSKPQIVNLDGLFTFANANAVKSTLTLDRSGIMTKQSGDNRYATQSQIAALTAKIGEL